MYYKQVHIQLISSKVQQSIYTQDILLVVYEFLCPRYRPIIFEIENPFPLSGRIIVKKTFLFTKRTTLVRDTQPPRGASREYAL
jgi:hypothetical protein